MEGGVLKCIAAFVVAGGFQSGAGSLAVKLQGHPNVAWGPGSTAQLWGEWGKHMEGTLPSRTNYWFQMQ